MPSIPVLGTYSWKALAVGALLTWVVLRFGPKLPVVGPTVGSIAGKF